MEVGTTDRGFGVVWHPNYPDGQTARLLQESSAVGDYADAIKNPGSSALWVGGDFHLNREEVEDLIGYLDEWLTTGQLNRSCEQPSDTEADQGDRRGSASGAQAAGAGG
jgi:hypothetical protein